MNFSTRKKEQNSSTKETLKKVFKILGRVLACVIAVVLILAVTLVAAIYKISRGKSEVVREMFVTAMVETGALDFCAHMFLSDDEVNEIIEKNRIIVPEGTTDETLVVIGGGDSDPERQGENEEKDREQGIVYDKDGICLIDIKGKTFVGKMLVVKDPSRVKVTGLPKYGDGIVGKSTEQMARETDALAAINAGGYREMSDYKTGGIPQGIDGPGVVIIDGEMRWGNLDYTYDFIGFDNSNILRSSSECATPSTSGRFSSRTTNPASCLPRAPTSASTRERRSVSARTARFSFLSSTAASRTAWAPPTRTSSKFSCATARSTPPTSTAECPRTCTTRAKSSRSPTCCSLTAGARSRRALSSRRPKTATKGR